MKNAILTLALLAGASGFSQKVIQTINSGGFIAASGPASVGEIIVPQNASQPASGFVAIVAQVHQQFLETPDFSLSENVTVYPNPTTAGLFFNGVALSGKKISVYAENGQLVVQQAIGANNAADLSALSKGLYLIQVEGYSKSFKIIKN